MSHSFTHLLREGRKGERLIAHWLMRRGFSVLPAYAVSEHDAKGPRVFSMEGDLISPDLFVFGQSKAFWVEAKSKAAFTWHRISQTYQDGIDIRCWDDYRALRERINWPVWLLFLHGPHQRAKDNPPDKTPPTGLFGGEIERLATCIHHRSDNYGSGGMVYWCHADLCKDDTGGPNAQWNEASRAAHDTFANPPAICKKSE